MRFSTVFLRRAGAMLVPLAFGAGCHGSTGGTGDAGNAGPDAVAPGDDAMTTGPADAGVPFEPLPPGVYATKVKNLLVGQPLTDAEYRQVVADPSTLGALIDTWTTASQFAPLFQARMLVFFGHAFQQNQATFADYKDLGFLQNDFFRGRGVPTLYMRALNDTFPRTAVELMNEGRPFNEVVTTDRYMMSTATMSIWAYIDAQPYDDDGIPLRAESWLLQQFPHLATTSVTNSVPIAQSIDPASPNYMHWQYNDGGQMDPPVQMGNPAVRLVMGALVQSEFQPGDWTDYRMVTVRTPTSGTDAKTLFWNVPSFRDPATNTLVLQNPRVGFFSTPAFQANWNTNSSNQARVTANQTMIVALGTAFDDTGTIVPIMSAAGDAAHAQPGSVCYACHQTLDPMRDLIRESWTYGYALRPASQLGGDGGIPTTGAFSVLGSTPQTGQGVGDLARFAAGHPNFAAAWTQKLCQYANSTSCDTSDPEFQRVAGVFQSSHFDFRRLIHELFASPLVTFATVTQSASAHGTGVSIARRDTLCFGLAQRFALSDPCGVATDRPANPTLAHQALSIPGDGYSRGVAAAITPTDPGLFFVAATQGICRTLATTLVDARGGSRYASTSDATVNTALDDFVATVMAVPPSDPRSAPLRTELRATYDDAHMQAGATASLALQATFVVACSSPTAVSTGL